MSILSILKKKVKLSPPLWETDFDKFAETAPEDEIEKYISTLPEGQEIDYTQTFWGHTYVPDNKKGSFVHYGHGFYEPLMGGKWAKAGDTFLLKTGSGKIGIYRVLHLKYERDPKDMFWAYVVGTGYKDQS